MHEFNQWIKENLQEITGEEYGNHEVLMRTQRFLDYGIELIEKSRFQDGIDALTTAITLNYNGIDGFILSCEVTEGFQGHLDEDSTVTLQGYNPYVIENEAERDNTRERIERDALMHRGVAYLMLNNTGEAAVDFADLASTCPAYLFLLGACYEHEADPGQAEVCYGMAKEHGIEHENRQFAAIADFYLSFIYNGKGDVRKASESISDYLKGDRPPMMDFTSGQFVEDKMVIDPFGGLLIDRMCCDDFAGTDISEYKRNKKIESINPN